MDLDAVGRNEFSLRTEHQDFRPGRLHRKLRNASHLKMAPDVGPGGAAARQRISQTDRDHRNHAEYWRRLPAMTNWIALDRRDRQRGATLVFFAFFIIFLMGAAALAIDLGMLYVARSEAQRAADAAALAGANVFTGGCSATNSCGSPAVQTIAAQSAVAAAQANFVAGTQGSVDCDLSSGAYAAAACPGIRFSDPTS